MKAFVDPSLEATTTLNLLFFIFMYILYLRYVCVSHPSIHANIKMYSVILHIFRFYRWYLLWIEYILPTPNHHLPNSYVEALTPNVMVLKGGAFGKVFMFSWDHEGGDFMMELVSL